MARVDSTHRCRSCGAVAGRWVGRCPECGEWNSLERCSRARPGTGSRSSAGAPSGRLGPVPLAEVDPDGCRPLPTGLPELDRVLSGGLVAGSATLVYGEPGAGKSTLLLQVLASVAAAGAEVLLVSAEESVGQVRARSQRMGPVPGGLMAVAADEVGDVEEAVTALRPDLVVVDSVQALVDPAAGGGPGTVAQVRACADRLVRLARDLGTPLVLVGQVTKDGGLAGPRALEHLVDTVVALEGDRHHALRLLRAVKHRFGTTGEVGLFEIGPSGLEEVADPGPLLLGDRRPDVPGSVVTPVLEGRRPLLVEIQALACTGAPGTRRRNVQGLDPRRLATLAAVLECRAGIALEAVEVFASVAGGVRVTEPAADLALALAVASAVAGVPCPSDLVSCGEVGLAGEVRRVPGIERRLAESARLGFTRALVPASGPHDHRGMTVLPVANVTEAVTAALRLRQEEDAGPRHDAPDRPLLPAATMPTWSSTVASR